MTFLALQSLSAALLPSALALDQRCFGGLWTLASYQRELESPNSEVLVLVEEAGFDVSAQPNVGRSQEAEGSGQKAEDRGQEAEGSGEAIIHSQLTTHNSQLSSLSAQSATQNSPPLLGLGCYWAILEEAHITMLAIDPAYQRQGLGQALLYALMASSHARGLERATLEVRISNHAALSLYQKFDFREAGQRRRYYPDNQEDALVLWRGGMQTPEFVERLNVWQQQVCDRLKTAGWQLAVGFEP